MDNRLSVAFVAWPERLVAVGADRRIVYPGKPASWGFSPEEARDALVAALEPWPATLDPRSGRQIAGHTSDDPDERRTDSGSPATRAPASP